jgi:hypothetical protein
MFIILSYSDVPLWNLCHKFFRDHFLQVAGRNTCSFVLKHNQLFLRRKYYPLDQVRVENDRVTAGPLVEFLPHLPSRAVLNLDSDVWFDIGKRLNMRWEANHQRWCHKLFDCTFAPQT